MDIRAVLIIFAIGVIVGYYRGRKSRTREITDAAQMIAGFFKGK